MADNTVPAVPEPPQALDSFLSLEFGRQIGLMVGLAASVALGVGIALWLVLEKDYAPLLSSLDRVDGSEVIALLDTQEIDYRIDQTSGALLVDASKIHEARMALASAGMPTNSSVGFELLDGEQPLGTSQFMEDARYRRGLEGELGRTISSISAIKAARVHIAMPRASVFLRDDRNPEASVFLETYQGLAVGEQQVKAIANLVASSVPELSLQNVTVVDHKGNLLSDFEEAGVFAQTDRQMQYRQEMEASLMSRLNSLLETVLGRERFRAELAVELDFTQSEQTAEIFNPDLPAVRSEQTTTEQVVEDAAVAGVPGALNNQPPAEGVIEGQEGAQGGGATPSRSRVLETRNFELDRTISYTQQQIGVIRKITVAVAIDDKPGSAAAAETESDDAEASAAASVWTQEELDRLAVLVQNAVGYDVTRGDRVSVINTPFFREDVEEFVEPNVPIWEQAIFWTAAKILGGVLAFLIVVFVILRPAMKRLTDTSKQMRELEYNHQQALQALNQAGGEASIGEDGKANSSRQLPSPGGAQLDGQLSMVRDMVSKEPERVAEVIQGWSAQNE